MAENAVFTTELEIVPKFDRNKAKKELREAMAELKAEVNNINNNLKIGVVVDDNKLKALVKNISKTLNDMGAAFDQEKSIGYTNKLTSGLKDVMTTASGVRREAIDTVKELNKLSKYTAISKDKSPDISKYYTDFNNTMKLPSSSVTEARSKVKELQSRLGELSALRVNINIDPKQISKLDDAINKASVSINKIKGGLSYKLDKELINFTPVQSYKDLYNTIVEIEKRQKGINTGTKEGVLLYNQMEVKRKSLIDILYKEENKQKEINSVLKESIGAGKDMMRLPEKSIADVNTKMGMLKENVEWLNMVKVEFNLDSKQVKVLNSEINKSKDSIDRLQKELDKNFKFKSNDELLNTNYGSDTENILAQKEIAARMKDINTTTIEGERLYSQMGEKVRKLKFEEKERVSIGNQINERLSTYIMYSQRAINMPSNSLDEAKAKIKSLKESIADLSNIGGSVKLDYDQVTKVRNELEKTKKELSNVTKSLRGMPDANLMQMKGTSTSSNNNIINELRRRQSQLNYTTAEGSKQYSEMERRIALLNKRQQELIGTTNGVGSAMNNTTSSMKVQSSVLNQMQVLARQYLGVYAVARVAKNITDITGEFELQRIALGAIINDQTKANQLFEESKRQAVQSPYQVKDIITYMKQLSAFQVVPNEISETTKRLADISSGLGVDMSRIILAFGQVKAASVLRGQELRQFTEAGIPMVQKLADKFTILKGEVVSTGDVFKLISEKQVPFEMVKDVLWDLTDAGGAFFDMQKKQSETIKGSMSNLTDEIQIAYNKIGAQNIDLIKGTIDLSKELIHFGAANIDILSNIGVAFISAKAGIMLYNKVLGEQNTLIMSNIKAEQGKINSALNILKVTRNVSQEEENLMNISRVSTMTNKQRESTDLLLKQAQASRLIIMKKLTAEEMQSLITQGLVTQEQVNNITNLRASGTAITTLGNKVKLFGLQSRLTFAMATASVKAFTISLLRNPMTWIFAAITAITTIISSINQAKEANEEFKKSMREDATHSLDQLRKINTDMPDNIIKIKARLDINGFEEDFKEMNKYLLEKMSSDELLSSMAKERIKNLETEKEKYNELIKLLKDYQSALYIIKENPDAIKNSTRGNGFQGIDTFTGGFLKIKLGEGTETDFGQLYESINKVINAMKQLSETDYKGADKLKTDIKQMQEDGATLFEIMDKIKKSPIDLRILREKDLKTDNIFKDYESNLVEAQNEYNIFRNNLKYNLPSIDGIKIDWDKSDFGVPKNKIETVQTQLKTMFDSTFKDAKAGFLDILNSFLNKDYKMNIIPKFIKLDSNLDKEGTAINEGLSKIFPAGSKPYLTYKITATEEGNAGLIELAEKVIKEYKDASSKYKQYITAFTKTGNKTYKELADDEKERIDSAKKISSYYGIALEKEKKTGNQRLSLFEKQYKIFQGERKMIDDARKSYQELEKVKGSFSAQKDVLSIFGESLPKSFKTNFSNEEYKNWLETELSNLEKIAKKGLKDKNTIIELKTDIKSIEAKDIEEKAKKILEKIQDIFDNESRKLDFSKALKENGFSEALAYSLATGLDLGFDNITDKIEQNLRNQINSIVKNINSNTKIPEIQLDIPIPKGLDLFKLDIKEYLLGFDKLKDNAGALTEEGQILLKLMSDLQKLSTDPFLNAAKVMDKYQSNSDKINKINKEADDDKKALTDYLNTIQGFGANELKLRKEISDKIILVEKDRKEKIASIYAELLANQQEYIDLTTYNAETGIKRLKEIYSKWVNIISPKNLDTSEKGYVKFNIEDKSFRLTEKEFAKIKKEVVEIGLASETTFEKIIEAFTKGKDSAIDFQKGLKLSYDEFEKIKSIVESIGSGLENTGVKLDAGTKNTLNGVSNLVGGLGSAGMAAAQFETDPIAATQSAISSITQLVTAFNSFANADNEKEIELMNKAIKESQRLINELQNELNDEAGNAYFSNLSKQVREYEVQLESAQRQLAAARSKSKPNKDEISQYEDAVTSAQQNITSKIKEMVEALTGGNIKTISENLINVWLEAYKSGSNTFSALKKEFGSMIQNMITQTIAAEVVKTRLQGIFDYITGVMKSRGTLTTSDIDKITAEGLIAAQDINATMQTLAPLYSQISNTLGAATSTANSLQNGISGASEETVSILAGYWLSHLNVTTTMSSNVLAIKDMLSAYMNSITSINTNGYKTASSEMNNYSEQYLQQLTLIGTNTGKTVNKLNEVYDLIKSMRVMNTDGDTMFALKTK